MLSGVTCSAGHIMMSPQMLPSVMLACTVRLRKSSSFQRVQNGIHRFAVCSFQNQNYQEGAFT